MTLNTYGLYIKKTLERLWTLSSGTVTPIKDIDYLPCEYKKGDTLPEADAGFYRLTGDLPGGKDKHGYLRFHVTADDADPHKKPYLQIKTSGVGTWDALNPQFMLYINGKLRQGLDINHTEYPLESGRDYDVLLYYYSGMNDCTSFAFSAGVRYEDIALSNLYYDISVPFDACRIFPEHYDKHVIVEKHLVAACRQLDFSDVGSDAFYESVRDADAYLKKELYERLAGKETTLCRAVSLIGHTHIDVAWRWTYAQTKEKAQRSFATVLQLMEEFPEYTFMSSQPQLYEYLKEEAPETYERVKEAVKSGRWEPAGGMWVEADCNLPSGESLVRQILFGRRFFKEEFGIDDHILWLPDVFGYSAALPQILKKSGIDTFVTSKISWNDTDKIPCDTFMWRGIDGTEIFSYFLTAQNSRNNQPDRFTTYNGDVTPSQVLGTWERYQQKDYNDSVCLTFGFGDGGGGPTREMLLRHRRLEKGLPGIPKTVMENPSDFFSRVRENFDKNSRLLPEVPTWSGELYLELHRGTYTTMAKNKKLNRMCEFLLGKAEALSVFADVLLKSDYPKAELQNAWKTVLLNQFHDVLPGSSIGEVYEDSDRLYAGVVKDVKAIKNEKLRALAAAVETDGGLFLYNPNGMPCDGIAAYEGKTYTVRDVPAFGWKVITPKESASRVRVRELTAENDWFILRLSEEGEIASLYDKRARREVFRNGMTGNRFALLEDYPYAHDAWDITRYARYKSYALSGKVTVTPYNDEVCGGFEVRHKEAHFDMIQKILIYDDMERIDFVTWIDWHEDHRLLKVYFPFAVNTDSATYEIQFGSVRRPTHENTSWDKAQFEVVGHKWMDVSDHGYGVSLLNNGKYGYETVGSEVSMSLLKAPTEPNPTADRGEHTFIYSLYPHTGALCEPDTIRQAYMLNNPVEFLPVGAHHGILPSCRSMVMTEQKNIVIETVKKAEDSDDVIVRFYEATNAAGMATLRFGFPVKEVYLCDLSENEEMALPVTDGAVDVSVKGFEIVTLKLKR